MNEPENIFFQLPSKLESTLMETSLGNPGPVLISVQSTVILQYHLIAPAQMMRMAAQEWITAIPLW